MILAHAFGARYDLPVPLYLFVLGGALVVFVSFLVVLPTAVTGRGVPAAPDRVSVPALRVVRASIATAVALLIALAGLLGSQEIPENILPTAFWLIFWIAVPVSCGVLGDWTRQLNPFAVIARACDGQGLRTRLIGGPALSWPRWLGWWPAVFFFLAASSGELIFNATLTIPHVTAIALLMYALVTALGSVVFGAQTWLERAEVFSVIFATWGRIGWWRFGTPGRNGFLGGLDAIEFEPTVSRVTFVYLLLVSVSFDGLLSTPWWRNERLHLASTIAPNTWPYELSELGAYLVLLGIAWAFFGGFGWLVHRVGRLEGGPLRTVAGLTPSMVPIAFGYLVAHNLDYLLVNGQLLFPLLGNPAGVGWWPHFPFPFNDSYEVHRNLVPTGAIWYFQVVLIVAVHVAAVVLAHRYLARNAEAGREKRSEWPWIVAMVGYTMTSLWLLAQPVVKGG